MSYPVLRAMVVRASKEASELENILSGCPGPKEAMALACVAAEMAAACFIPASRPEELELGMSYANLSEQLLLRANETKMFNSPMQVSLMLQCCAAHDKAGLHRAVLVCLCFTNSVQTMDSAAIKLLNTIITDNREHGVARFLLLRATFWMASEPAATRLRYRPLAHAALNVLKSQLQSTEAVINFTRFMAAYFHWDEGVLPPSGSVTTLLSALQLHMRYEMPRLYILDLLSNVLELDAFRAEAAATEWAAPLAGALRSELDEKREDNTFRMVIQISTMGGERSEAAAVAAGIVELAAAACKRLGGRADHAASVLAALGIKNAERFASCGGLAALVSTLENTSIEKRQQINDEEKMLTFINGGKLEASDRHLLVNALTTCQNNIMYGVDAAARISKKLIDLGAAGKLDEAVLQRLAGERTIRRLEAGCPESAQGKFMKLLRRRCGHCGENPANRKLCKVCKQVYCSEACQRCMWGDHKLHCKSKAEAGSGSGSGSAA